VVDVGDVKRLIQKLLNLMSLFEGFRIVQSIKRRKRRRKTKAYEETAELLTGKPLGQKEQARSRQATRV